MEFRFIKKYEITAWRRKRVYSMRVHKRPGAADTNTPKQFHGVILIANPLELQFTVL